MRCVLLFLALCGLAAGQVVSPTEFRGSAALENVRKLVAFGPHPSGSPAIKRVQAYILQSIRPTGGQVMEDAFTAQTPNGPVLMRSILLKFPGTSGRAVVITGHYDTKIFAKFAFVGANDAGSSAGSLIELARALAHTKHKDDILLVWFDGEEAVRDWTATDSLYGSRHLAEKWQHDGTARKIRALINIDMIGDQELDILNDSNSDAGLRRIVWSAARDLGYGSHFLTEESGIEDDHIPFVKAGVPSLDLIDFDYGPNNRYWHTAQDTMDKLSASSLQIVGSVVLETINRLEK